MADLVHSNKFKKKIKHSRKSNIFTLATDERSSRKMANSKYDPIGSEMNECLGELKAAIVGKSLQNRKSPHECIPACARTTCGFDYLTSLLRYYVR